MRQDSLKRSRIFCAALYLLMGIAFFGLAACSNQSPQSPQSPTGTSRENPAGLGARRSNVIDEAREGDCLFNPHYVSRVYRRVDGFCDTGDRRITAAEAQLVRSGRIAELKKDQPITSALTQVTSAQQIATPRHQLERPPLSIESLDEERVARGEANVREQPIATSERLAALARGDRIHVIGRVNGSDWLQVQTRDKLTGYVLGSLLSPIEAPVVAAATRTPSPKPNAAFLPDQRYALVIGNSEYRDFGRLRNPVNDSRAMASALERLGFAVTRVDNVSRERMARAVLDHASKLRSGGTGVMFFAGHGLQVRGVNYLLPVEANPTNDAEADVVAISLNWVLQTLGDAANTSNIVILDACRNNPLQTALRTASRGLAVVRRATGNTLVIYATSPDSVAADGDGANGLFTIELLRHIEAPGITVESMFKRVVSGVRQRSAGAQIPWMNGSLETDIVLKR